MTFLVSFQNIFGRKFKIFVLYFFVFVYFFNYNQRTMINYTNFEQVRHSQNGYIMKHVSCSLIFINSPYICIPSHPVSMYICMLMTLELNTINMCLSFEDRVQQYWSVSIVGKACVTMDAACAVVGCVIELNADYTKAVNNIIVQTEIAKIA